MAAAPQGYTGDMSLGGATFSLAIDTASLDRGLRTAEASARDASQRIGSALGRGSSAAQGLLYLGQAVDDLQYGFRAIVNNIPQIVMAMGGGAGFAGAVGIAAVALNQVVTHLDELKASIGQSQGMSDLAAAFERVAAAVDEISQATQGRGLMESILGPNFMNDKAGFVQLAKYFGLTSGSMAAGRHYAAEAAQGERDRAEVGKVGSSAAAERARLFKEAMEAFGGGDRLMATAAERLGNRFPNADQRRLQNMADAMIRHGMAGGALKPGSLGPEFEKHLGAAMYRAETEMLNRAGKENEDRTGKPTDWAKILNAEGAENERRTRARLEGERDALQQQMRAMHENAAAMRPSQQFASVKDYLSSVSVSGADAVRKQQLDRLKAIDANTKRVADQINKLGQAKFQ